MENVMENFGEHRETTSLKPSSANKSGWKRLFAASLVLISSFIYFATYDMPGSLVKIIEKIFHIKTDEFEYLYTFYGVPSVFVCLFCGLLIDRVFGLYKGLVYFVIVSLIGQSVITLGGFLQTYWMMVAGRFIYGIGTESMITALNCVIVLWFKGKDISFVFGMFQSFLRLGTSFAFSTAVPLYDRLEKNESIHKRYVFGVTLIPFLFLVVLQLINVGILSYFTYKNLKHDTPSTNVVKNDVKLIYIIRLPLKYWIIIAMFCISSSTVYAFVSCSQELFEKKYDLSIDQANHFSTFFNLFTSISIPFIGLFMNQVGFDLTVNLIGCFLGILGQLILSATKWSPYFPLIIYSICITIINICTMPMIPMVVDEFQVATAYGVLQSLINAATSLLQILAGYILVKAGPESLILFFMSCLIFGFLCTVVLLIMDKRDNGILNISAKKRNALLI